jgi:hypothetical protein
MADPVVNISQDTANVVRIIQDGEDIVRISDTTITEKNEIILVSPNSVQNLSYLINIDPPTISSSPGTLGEMRFDGEFLYICVSANSWKRIALSSF